MWGGRVSHRIFAIDVGSSLQRRPRRTMLGLLLTCATAAEGLSYLAKVRHVAPTIDQLPHRSRLLRTTLARYHLFQPWK